MVVSMASCLYAFPFALTCYSCFLSPSDVLKRHVKSHPTFENKSAGSEAAMSSPDEDMADPASTTAATTTMAVQDGGVAGNLETSHVTNAQQTWDQLTQDLWSFHPPYAASYKPDDAAIVSNQLPLDQNTGFIYGQAHHEPAFTIPHLDATEIDTSTNASSVPLQGWDFMESAPTSLASSILQDQDHSPDTRSDVNKASLISKENIDAYFSKIHPFWPILHSPTFEIDKASDILLTSMAMLADWMNGGSEHGQSCTALFEATATSQLVRMLGVSVFSPYDIANRQRYVASESRLECTASSVLMRRLRHMPPGKFPPCKQSRLGRVEYGSDQSTERARNDDLGHPLELHSRCDVSILWRF